MSEREVRRVEVLNEVQSGRRTGGCCGFYFGHQRAAGVPASGALPGERWVWAGAQGAGPKRRTGVITQGVRKYAGELVKTDYADFGPTLATEALA